METKRVGSTTKSNDPNDPVGSDDPNDPVGSDDPNRLDQPGLTIQTSRPNPNGSAQTPRRLNPARKPK